MISGVYVSQFEASPLASHTLSINCVFLVYPALLGSLHSLSGNKNSYWQVLCLAPLVQPSFTLFIYFSNK